MTHHFGVLIPSTNTTTETEFSRLPDTYQAHYARLLSSTPGRPFAPSRDEDIDYQSKLLATAKVEVDKILAAARDQARGIIDQANMRATGIVEQAKADGEAARKAQVEAARAEIDVEINRAREELRGQVARIAVAGAEKVLGREIDENAHRDLLGKLAAEI